MHRLALDHPERVRRMMLLDIAPTLFMYEKTDMRFVSRMLNGDEQGLDLRLEHGWLIPHHPFMRSMSPFSLMLHTDRPVSPCDPTVAWLRSSSCLASTTDPLSASLRFDLLQTGTGIGSSSYNRVLLP